MQSLERLLGEMHGKRFCCLVGNATAGIVMAIEAAGIQGGKIAIPNNVCINVPMAVFFSGNEPVYLDINESDMGLDPNELRKNIHNVSAVIAVHSYGSVCQIEQIRAVCKTNGIFLIEDFCVAQGAEINGDSVGRFGDVSVVSFGAGKIIDVGHGGAVLTDDKEIINYINKRLTGLDEYSVTDKKRETLSRYHTELYNEYYASGINEVFPKFKAIALSTRNSYFYRFSKMYAKNIERGVLSLKKNLEDRERKKRKFYGYFSKKEFQHIFQCLDIPQGSVCWRFSLFVDKKIRDFMLKGLLQEKIKVSSWYPSVDLFFDDRKALGNAAEVSDSVGDTIINFWVNDEVDDSYFCKIKTEVESIIKKINC